MYDYWITMYDYEWQLYDYEWQLYDYEWQLYDYEWQLYAHKPETINYKLFWTVNNILFVNSYNSYFVKNNKQSIKFKV